MASSQNDPLRWISFTRRGFMQSSICVPLAGCRDSETVSVRYRVIARITYNGRPFEASTVMECSYTRVKNSLIGAGAATTLYGEALIFDLPNGKTIFLLPYSRSPSGSLNQLYEHVLTRTIGIKHGVGNLSDADLAKLKSASGLFPLFTLGALPAIVAFGDEKNPKTIFEIEPYASGKLFPGARPLSEVFTGVQFVGVDIEITHELVSNRLRSRLPWLNGSSQRQIFDRDTPPVRAYIERPIGHIITISNFFGDGSR